MARLKKVYTDEKYELDRKRNRIQTTLSCTLAAFWVLMLIVMGIFQEQAMIVGAGAVLIGLGTFAYVAFRIYTWVKGWKIMTVYDEPELRRSRHRMWSFYQQEKEEIKTKQIILDVVLTVIGFLALILGILRLCGWM